MPFLSPAEVITQSFYAWETRGRGWMLADYPVCLEPPFRYCFVLADLVSETKTIDDGRRPTILSSMVEGVRNVLAFPREEVREVLPPFDEPEPYPALETPPLVTFRVTVPADHATRAETMTRLLVSLSTCFFPVSLELIGHDGKVCLQIVCADADKEHVGAQLLAYVPDASVIEGKDLLATLWDRRQEHLVVDFGLSEEFFLPLEGLSAQKLDPFLSLVPSLAEAAQGEFLLFQALFQGTSNPWREAIRNALDDGRGGSVFADAPEFPKLAAEKLRSPLFAVSVRIAAQAEDGPRAWHLARSTEAFFHQLARQGSNAFLPLENGGYPDALHEEAVLTRQSYRTGMLLSADELASLAHLPDASIRHPALVRDERRTQALPSEALGHPHVLGENRHRGKVAVATLSDTERLQHTWIVGASGTGKSTLLLNLITEDIALGHGVAVLDPHGDLIDDILARIPEERKDDVVLFDPSDTEWPIGFNILSAGSEGERTILASDLVGIFRRFSTSWGDTMSAVLGNAVLAILEHPKGGTLLDLRRLLVDEGFRKQYLKDVEDEEVAFFWSREFPLIGSRSVGPILTRLDTFLRPKTIRHIVGQPEKKLRFSDIMESKKIFLGKLSHGLIGEENSYLLGSLLVGKFLGLALARQQFGREERTAFFLHADEFQHFLTPSMETLLTATRKYGVGATLAHQTLAQLKDAPKVEGALFGNAYTRIVFRTGEGDARALSEGFSFFEAKDIASLGRGEAIVRSGSSGSDFNLKTFPASIVPEDEAARRRESLTALSRQRYAVPVDELKARLREQYGTKEEAVLTKPPEPLREQVAPISTALPPVIEQMMTERQKDARANVRPPEPAPLGRGGQEHKYLQHLVKRLAEERGFRAVIEEAAGAGRADVVLSKDQVRVAIEVSVTTDPEHEAENLRKCRDAGFEQIVFLVPDKKRREKLQVRFREEPNAVSVIAPEQLVGMLDACDPGARTAETSVRGYTVKVTRQALSPEEAASRRSAIAAVIAKTLQKGK